MNRPRVLFVSKPIDPPWHDGSKNLVRDVATHLTRATATVMTTPEGARAGTLLGSRARTEAVYRDLGGFSPPLLANARVFERLLRGDPLDAWHFVFAPNAASSSAAFVAKRVQRMRGFRGPVFQTIASAPRSFSGVSRLLFGDHIVVLSEWTRGRLVGAGVTGVPITVIPPCAVAPAEPDGAVVDELRAKHKLQGPVILYPGDWEFSNGALNFLRALPEIFRAHPKATAVFACRKKTVKADAAEAKILAAAHEMGLRDRIRSLGEVTDMAALLRSANVVAFPVDDLYGKVDVPLVLIEALALGVPTVVAAGGPLESLAPAAAVVRPDDTEALAAAVLGLLDNPEGHAAAASRGRDMYDARFSPNKVANAYDDLYEQVLAAPR